MSKFGLRPRHFAMIAMPLSIASGSAAAFPADGIGWDFAPSAAAASSVLERPSGIGWV